MTVEAFYWPHAEFRQQRIFEFLWRADLRHFGKPIESCVESVEETDGRVEILLRYIAE